MGPLGGFTIIEIGSIGPGPFCGMLLSDLGARVVRIARPGPSPYGDLLHRGREAIAIDLKNEAAAEVVLRMVAQADGLIEGFRPGVAERLGIGPAEALDRNPRLVYGRMTGFGQEGPLAASAGHDIDYIAVSGVLDLIGTSGGPPVVPLNLVGDLGGGGMLLAVGLLAGLLEAGRSGRGQVIDAAMIDGSAVLGMFPRALAAAGQWEGGRGENLIDGGAPFYCTYETGDGRYVAVGALEPHFYAHLVRGLGLEAGDLPEQYDRTHWPDLRAVFEEVFVSKTRDEWVEIFAGTDACVAPVLTPSEAPFHPHNVVRRTFVDVDGVTQAAPAPRFDRTPADFPGAVPTTGRDSVRVLESFGFEPVEIEPLLASGAVVQDA
ncbi:MAG: CaiB/BaiF CoA-transferase family protein [Acidimicrobiia bacterium]